MYVDSESVSGRADEICWLRKIAGTYHALVFYNVTYN